MKHKSSILFAMLLALSSCGGTPEVTSANSEEPSTTTSTTSEVSVTSDTSAEDSETSVTSDTSVDESSDTSESTQVTSLKINLEKTSYFEFETLDLSLLTVSITFSDTTQKTVGRSELTNYDLSLSLLDPSGTECDLGTILSVGTYKLVVKQTDSQIKDEIEINVIEEDLSGIGGETLDSLIDNFKVENGTYTAEECRSVKIFDGYLNKGTYSVDLLRNGNVYDDFIIFAYNETDKSYYSFGLNIHNKLQITYFNGTKLILVKALDKEATGKVTLTVAFNNLTGAVDYYLNDEFVYANNINVNGDLKYGFYAGTKGSIFSNVMTNEDDALLDNDFTQYETANGTIEYNDDSIITKTVNGLNYHKTKRLTHGVFEVTYNAKDATNNIGIAFCIDSNDRTKFFREMDVTYYYLCVTIHGTVGLYRVMSKTATLLKNINTKWYYKDQNHTLKAVRDNNNVIHAFLDEVYLFSYVDNHPFKGDMYGISANSANALYYHVSAKAGVSMTDEAITNYDVVSGSFYKNKNLIVSNDKNSMIVNKEPGTLNGTLEAEIAMGSAYGTGLVFRLTKPNTDKYLEKEEGLSYYWLNIKSSNRIDFGKVSNGTIAWTMEKYMPYFMSNAAKCKIVLDGSNIYAYFSNVLVFHYVDENPLTGLYYGLRSETKGAAICGDMRFTSSTEHEQSKYLIFGHSYTQLWHRYKEDFSEFGDEINNIGIGGSQTIHWSEQYNEEVTCYNPEWGIYWNGINDINVDVPVDKILERFTSCLTYIKGKLPNFKCVVISVARCAYDKSMAHLQQIEDVNKGLKELCDSNNYLVYVDVEKLFCDESGNPIETYFVDKLHPTAEGYKLVAPLVVNAIKNYQE